MNTDTQLLLYHCLQFGYTKPVRTRHRINVNQLAILASIYYATTVNPKRWGNSVKQCVKTLNPQFSSYYILRDLHILNDRGLIDYNETNPKSYSITISKEGRQVIESLFDPENIDRYLEANKDKI